MCLTQMCSARDPPAAHQVVRSGSFCVSCVGDATRIKSPHSKFLIVICGYSTHVRIPVLAERSDMFGVKLDLTVGLQIWLTVKNSSCPAERMCTCGRTLTLHAQSFSE